jgi:hypothetical protein
MNRHYKSSFFGSGGHLSINRHSWFQNHPSELLRWASRSWFSSTSARRWL